MTFLIRVTWLSFFIVIFIFLLTQFSFADTYVSNCIINKIGGGSGNQPACTLSNGSTNNTPTTGTSDATCTTSMTADEINSYFSENGFKYFNNTGATFVQDAAQYGINPALIIAVGYNETQLGNAYDTNGLNNSTYLGSNNAFGLYTSTSVPIQYPTWADSATAAFQTISSYSDSTGSKCLTEADPIQCIGNIWAPIGVSNDPNNLNVNWVPGVKRTFAQIPQHSCTQPTSGGGSSTSIPPDSPSGWPLVLTSDVVNVQCPYNKGSTFDHQSLQENAVDMSAPRGTPVYSTMNGVVTETSDGVPPGENVALGYANHIKIENNGNYILFGHLLAGSLRVKQGDTVTRGELVAEVDDSGYSTGDHLHYELSPGLEFPQDAFYSSAGCTP